MTLPRAALLAVLALAAAASPAAAQSRTLYRAGPGRVEMDLSRDGKFERSDDWSACAYFYLDRPENGLPPLAPAAERIVGL